MQWISEIMLVIKEWSQKFISKSPSPRKQKNNRIEPNNFWTLFFCFATQKHKQIDIKKAFPKHSPTFFDQELRVESGQPITTITTTTSTQSSTPRTRTRCKFAPPQLVVFRLFCHHSNSTVSPLFLVSFEPFFFCSLFFFVVFPFLFLCFFVVCVIWRRCCFVSGFVVLSFFFFCVCVCCSKFWF